MKELTLEAAKELLHAHMQNVNLRRHCYAVGKTLAEFYELYVHENRKDIGSLTKEQWEIAGVLHDADWEETKDTPEEHTIRTLEWLGEYSVPEELLNVLRSHNHKVTHLREPETLLERTLECCDELTGFIVAVALVRPDKKIRDVEVDSVLKKFKQKEFARAVDRSDIERCEQQVNIELSKFINTTLCAMKDNSELLGL